MINLLFSYSLTYIQGRKGLAQQIEVKTKDQTTRPWWSLNGGKWYTVPLEHNRDVEDQIGQQSTYFTVVHECDGFF